MRTNSNAATAIVRNNTEEFLKFHGRNKIITLYLSREQDQPHLLNFSRKNRISDF